MKDFAKEKVQGEWLLRKGEKYFSKIVYVINRHCKKPKIKRSVASTLRNC